MEGAMATSTSLATSASIARHAQNGESHAPALVNATGSGDIEYEQRLLPRAIDVIATKQPDRAFGKIAKSTNISDGFRTITMSDMSRIVNSTAYLIDERLGDGSPSSTIAYLGISDFRHYAVLFAAMKTSHPILYFSPRNAIANNVALFRQSKCQTLFYVEEMATKVKELETAMPDLQTFQISSFDDMMSITSKHYPYTKTWEEAKSDVAVYVHSSGTTGAPKLIRYTNEFLLAAEYNGRREGTGPTYVGFAVFHLGGTMAGIDVVWHGTTMILGPPEAFMDPKVAIDVMREIELSQMVVVPAVLEAMVKEHSRDLIENPKNLKTLYFGGGGLAQSIGEFIASNTTITLNQFYGTAETGGLNSALTTPGQYWNSISFHPNSGIELEPLDPLNPSSVCEAVIKRLPVADGDFQRQPVFALYPELDEYRTKDLFIKNPIAPNMWKYQGRSDDVLVLSTTYKVNAVILETMIMSFPSVTGALVFGTLRPKCGLLVEVNSVGQPEEEVVNLLWPMLEKAVGDMQDHYRIERSMILVASPQKPLLRNAKGGVVRKSSEKLYWKEIEELYRRSS